LTKGEFAGIKTESGRESFMQGVHKKKIVYLIRTLNLGGAERYVVETATSLNRERFDPKIYCLSGGGPLQVYAQEHKVDVTIFDSSRPNSPKQIPFWRSRKFLSLCRYLKQERPDIVHCFMYSPSIYGAIAAKLMGNAAIITNRQSLGIFKDAKPHYQWLENLVNGFTDVVLVNSEAVKTDVLQRERVAPDKVQVIYGGVDIHRYTPVNGNAVLHRRRLQTKTAWGIPETAPVIGMIANLFRYKGYHEFIHAASDVCRDYPDARFLCIGEDRGIQQELEQLVDHLGLRHAVIFTGQVRKIEDLFPIIDIQVSASHEEGFSSAIIEGMAAGKPIVATAVGGNLEAVVHKVTGLLVPPQNPGALAHALKTCLDHPELASQFGSNGRKRVEEHFALEQVIAALETLYLKLGERKRAHRRRSNTT
jgi:glycosyltransferase involved in cell wall biosynthesis